MALLDARVAHHDEGMGQHDQPPGMHVLDRDRCEALLAQESTGRVAFADGRFPLILPVNYVFSHGMVVFRTQVGAKLENMPLSAVAFEVDGHSDFRAWSVLVQGYAREVTTALGPLYDEVRAIDIPTLAPGEKPHWIAIEIADISGRSFVPRS